MKYSHKTQYYLLFFFMLLFQSVALATGEQRADSHATSGKSIADNHLPRLHIFTIPVEENWRSIKIAFNETMSMANGKSTVDFPTEERGEKCQLKVTERLVRENFIFRENETYHYRGVRPYYDQTDPSGRNIFNGVGFVFTNASGREKFSIRCYRLESDGSQNYVNSSGGKALFKIKSDFFKITGPQSTEVENYNHFQVSEEKSQPVNFQQKEQQSAPGSIDI